MFRPKHRWMNAPVEKYISGNYTATEIANELNYIKIKVIISIIGKIIFYISAIALCFL